jgi:hypothetical protein
VFVFRPSSNTALIMIGLKGLEIAPRWWHTVEQVLFAAETLGIKQIRVVLKPLLPKIKTKYKFTTTFYPQRTPHPGPGITRPWGNSLKGPSSFFLPLDI